MTDEKIYDTIAVCNKTLSDNMANKLVGVYKYLKNIYDNGYFLVFAIYNINTPNIDAIDTFLNTLYDTYHIDKSKNPFVGFFVSVKLSTNLRLFFVKPNGHSLTNDFFKPLSTTFLEKIDKLKKSARGDSSKEDVARYMKQLIDILKKIHGQNQPLVMTILNSTRFKLVGMGEEQIESLVATQVQDIYNDLVHATFCTDVFKYDETEKRICLERENDRDDSNNIYVLEQPIGIKFYTKLFFVDTNHKAKDLAAKYCLLPIALLSHLPLASAGTSRMAPKSVVGTPSVDIPVKNKPSPTPTPSRTPITTMHTLSTTGMTVLPKSEIDKHRLSFNNMQMFVKLVLLDSVGELNNQVKFPPMDDPIVNKHYKYIPIGADWRVIAKMARLFVGNEPKHDAFMHAASILKGSGSDAIDHLILSPDIMTRASQQRTVIFAVSPSTAGYPHPSGSVSGYGQPMPLPTHTSDQPPLVADISNQLATIRNSSPSLELLERDREIKLLQQCLLELEIEYFRVVAENDQYRHQEETDEASFIEPWYRERNAVDRRIREFEILERKNCVRMRQFQDDVAAKGFGSALQAQNNALSAAAGVAFNQRPFNDAIALSDYKFNRDANYYDGRLKRQAPDAGLPDILKKLKSENAALNEYVRSGGSGLSNIPSIGDPGMGVYEGPKGGLTS